MHLRRNLVEVTEKWLLKNTKLITRLKNQTWTKPYVKNHKNSHELKTDQTTDTTQKTRYLKCLTSLTPSVEKTENLHGFK